MGDVLGHGRQTAALRQAERLATLASHRLPALAATNARPEAASGSAERQAGARVAAIDPSRLEAFIRMARGMVGRNASSPFSLDDVYLVARQLRLQGVLFLEKCAENRHVNVLLETDACRMLLYDPWLGVKVKSCSETHLGMYGKPVGSLRDEFERFRSHAASMGTRDVWAGYAQRGRRLLTFLQIHRERLTLWRSDAPCCVEALDLAAVQEATSPADCAPICLFVLSLLQPASTWGTRCAHQRRQPEQCVGPSG
jgi:hypothetical protein